jgi:hypothetical protein
LFIKVYMSFSTKFLFSIALLSLLALGAFRLPQPVVIDLKSGARISLIGGNLGSRMMHYGHFETEMHVRHPEKSLLIRNMCDGGDTPGFRPHPSRFSPWAFPGAEAFQTEYATKSDSEGHFESPDQWLTRLQTDIIVTFFGFSESFQGEAGLATYQAELDAFVKHTLGQRYNGAAAPQLVLVSPIAFEDLSDRYDLPNGKQENENLLRYTEAMRTVAQQNKVLFVDAFTPSKQWYANTTEPLTIDGVQLNEAGDQKLALLLVNEIFGNTAAKAVANRSLIREAVLEDTPNDDYPG